MMVGVNGSGKTTTIAKLGQPYRSEGKTLLFGAADNAGTVDERVVSTDGVGPESHAEITGMHDDSLPCFRRQPGRIANEYADVVPGFKRTVQHVGTERSRRAENDQPHLRIPPEVFHELSD